MTSRTCVARFLMDILHWPAYACVVCQERMAAPKSLLCPECEKVVSGG